MSRKHVFAPFQKVAEQDDGTLIVGGIATTETPDDAGEVILGAAMKTALPPWMEEWGNVREMHQKIAAGRALAAEVREDGSTYFEALVVDPVSVKKVQTGVLKGFSVAGNVTERDAENRKIIKALDITEISLVDRGMNPECKIQFWKCDGGQAALDLDPSKGSAPMTSQQKLAQFLAAKPDLVQKVLGLASAPSADKIEKGMYAVSRAAELFESMAYLLEGCEFEAQTEGDDSPVPAMIAEALSQFGAALKALAIEEIDEQLAEDETEKTSVVTAKAAAFSKLAPALRTLGDAVAKAKASHTEHRDVIEKAVAKKVKKALDAHQSRLEKCSQLAKVASDAVDECHQAFAATMEAHAGDEKEAEKAAAATGADPIAKAAELTAELAAAQDRVAKVSGERDELQKALAGITAERDQLGQKITAVQADLAKARGETEAKEKLLAEADAELQKLLAHQTGIEKALGEAKARLDAKGVTRVVSTEKAADNGTAGEAQAAPRTAVDAIKLSHQNPIRVTV